MVSNDKKTIAVIGATGQQGGGVVHLSSRKQRVFGNPEPGPPAMLARPTAPSTFLLRS